MITMELKKTQNKQRARKTLGILGLFVPVIGLIVTVIACIFAFRMVKIWNLPIIIKATKTPYITSEGQIAKIVETDKTFEVIESETTETNNCGISTSTEIEAQRVRTVEHLVVIESQGGISISDIELAQVPLLKLLKVNLEGKYGVQDKQSEQRTYTITFTTGANKWATHTVSWKYTWHIGNATLRYEDGREQVYSYKVRASLEPGTVSIEKGCSQTPALVPTAIP